MKSYYFNEDHEIFRQGLKDFLAKEVVPFIDEWEKEVAIMLEEDAFFDGKVCEYIDPRQTEMIEIDWDK